MEIKLGQLGIREMLGIILLTSGAFLFYSFIQHKIKRNSKMNEVALAALFIFGPTLLIIGIYLLLTIKKGDDKLPKHKLIQTEILL